MEIVGQHFRPEFINRVDESVVFHPLGKEQIKLIAKIQIANLQKRLQEKEFTLEISDKAMDFLSEAGFDPVYGARPLKRSIQQYLENPLAKDILEGKFKAGDKIKVDREGDGLVFKS